MADLDSTPEEEVLSILAHKLVDQVALYGLAKGIAKDPRIAHAIQKAKDDRAHLLQDINAKIFLNGIAPIEQGTKLGNARKSFQRLRDITEKDDLTALLEVERGEHYLKERFARAAADERLSAHTRNYLQTLVSRITRDHEEIGQLKQSVS